MNLELARRVYDRLLGADWRSAPLFGGNRRVPCPQHDDRRPSLDIHEGKGVWTCRSGCGDGGAWDLARAMLGEAAARELFRELDEEAAPKPRANRRFDFEDLGPPTQGQADKLRTARRIRRAADLEAMGVRRLRASGQDWLGFQTLDEGWKLWAVEATGRPRLDAGKKLVRRNAGPVSLVVSPALSAFRAGKPAPTRCYDVEGESDLLALVSSAPESVALTGTGGAAALTGHERHRNELRRLIIGDVVVIRDRDDAGRQGAEKAAAFWCALGVSVRVLELPEALGEKGDLRDYLLGRPARNGSPATEPLGTFADLESLADAAPVRNEATREPVAGSTARGAKGMLLCDVQRESVAWLWSGRIPRGKVTILEGDPDEGKSTLSMDLAARVSTGAPMPFDDAERRSPAGVVVLNAEDGLGDTIRPRLEAAEADLSRILGFAFDDLPEIPDGMGVIEDAVHRVGAALVIIDPLMAFITDKVNTWSDHHIRRALKPATALAQRTGAAVLVLRHLTKGGGSHAKYRGGGSIGILAASRSTLLAAPDPENPNRKILARVKNNLAAPAPSLAYDLMPVGDTVRVRWLETTTHKADALLRSDDADERSSIAEAKGVLADLLALGPVPTKRVLDHCRQAGLSERTIRTAKTKLGIEARKVGFGGGWCWALPASAVRQDVEDDQGVRASSSPSSTIFESLPPFIPTRPKGDDDEEATWTTE